MQVLTMTKQNHEPLDEFVTVKMTKSMKEKLKEIADSRYMSMSGVLKALLDEEIKKFDEENK